MTAILFIKLCCLIHSYLLHFRGWYKFQMHISHLTPTSSCQVNYESLLMTTIILTYWHTQALIRTLFYTLRYHKSNKSSGLCWAKHVACKTGNKKGTTINACTEPWLKKLIKQHHSWTGYCYHYNGVPLFPPQIPHGLTWEWNQSTKVRSQQLTPWAHIQQVSTVVMQLA
jgi:hypothetical protein